MRVRMFVSLGCAAALSACAGSGTPVTLGGAHAADVRSRAAEPQRSAAACPRAVVFVSGYDNQVHIYPQSSKTQCGAITGFKNPQGLAVDSGGNLWVVNTGTFQIFEYAPGATSPSLTLQDSSGFPSGVAVDNHSGYVYVTNFFQQGSKPGVIEVYPPGATQPSATLSDPKMQYAFFDAVDNAGNLYVTYTSADGVGHVYEWFGGTGTPTDLGIVLGAPGGIQTTASGALAICDQRAPACGTFAAGSTTMTGLFATKDGDPFNVALNAKEKRAFVTDVANGKLGTWKYPGPDSHGGRTYVLPNGAEGVAVSPADPNGAPW